MRAEAPEKLLMCLEAFAEVDRGVLLARREADDEPVQLASGRVAQMLAAEANDRVAPHLPRLAGDLRHQVADGPRIGTTLRVRDIVEEGIDVAVVRLRLHLHHGRNLLVALAFSLIPRSPARLLRSLAQRGRIRLPAAKGAGDAACVCSRVVDMQLLVLGGTAFLGRHVVAEALALGHSVTTFNRGMSGVDAEGVEALRGDRAVEDDLEQLRDRTFDAVVDTSGFDPRTVRGSLDALGDVGHYAFVSSISVYPGWPTESVDEESPVFACPPDAGPGVGYGEGKAGAERAVIDAVGDRALIVRAGLLLGPYENIGRLPWWLRRAARGGDMLAPGNPDRAMQLVDARDLAIWMLDCAARDVSGTYNATGPTGNVTMGSWLGSCAHVTGGAARLVWADDDLLLRHGVEPWTELPLWTPDTAEYAGIWTASTARAEAAGLRCRPVTETVADTWASLRTQPDAANIPPRGLPAAGIDPDKERAILRDLDAAVG
jgi:2'-hydroxyisoflavone reductase